MEGNCRSRGDASSGAVAVVLFGSVVELMADRGSDIEEDELSARLAAMMADVRLAAAVASCDGAGAILSV